jgi:hypothetical protein
LGEQLAGDASAAEIIEAWASDVSEFSGTVDAYRLYPVED